MVHGKPGMGHVPAPSSGLTHCYGLRSGARSVHPISGSLTEQLMHIIEF
jgi:hypothetical protein